MCAGREALPSTSHRAASHRTQRAQMPCKLWTLCQNNCARQEVEDVISFKLLTLAVYMYACTYEYIFVCVYIYIRRINVYTCNYDHIRILTLVFQIDRLCRRLTSEMDLRNPAGTTSTRTSYQSHGHVRKPFKRDKNGCCKYPQKDH